jgi:hypothetical protein
MFETKEIEAFPKQFHGQSFGKKCGPPRHGTFQNRNQWIKKGIASASDWKWNLQVVKKFHLRGH